MNPRCLKKLLGLTVYQCQEFLGNMSYACLQLHLLKTPGNEVAHDAEFLQIQDEYSKENARISALIPGTYRNLMKICVRAQEECMPQVHTFANEEDHEYYDFWIFPTQQPDVLKLFLTDSIHEYELRWLLKRMQHKLNKMNQKLLVAKNKAEKSRHLETIFLANINHEIRTPLNAIVGFSDLLKDAETEKEKQQYISLIEENNELLLQLIDEVLNLATIEAGTIKFKDTEIEISDLLRSILRNAQWKWKKQEISFRCDSLSDSLKVRIDADHLTQVLNHLIHNAIKFTQQGEVKIGYQPENHFLRFFVTDTGCGIPEDQQRRIFGRFVKLNSFTQGIGLGLTICQAIVQRMGGKIGVVSEEGKGSTFWFTIPWRPAG